MRAYLRSNLGLFVAATVACVACPLVAPGTAYAAEESTATEVAAARTLAVDGLKLAQAGNCAEAISKLERAEKLHHSAVVLARLGECYITQGRLVEGTEVLRKMLREPLPATAPAQTVKSYERAQQLLDTAKPRIAGLTVKVTVVPELVLRVDGQIVDTSLLDSEIPSDPGDHVVEATAPGYTRSQVRVTLAAADKKTVSLTLERDPLAVVATPVPQANSETPPRASVTQLAPARAAESASAPPLPPAEPNRTGAYVSLGVGVAAVGVGTAFGILTMKRKQDLNDDCPADACPKAKSDSLDTAKRFGTVSTVAFGVGAVGLALGTVLYFTAGSSSETASSASIKRSPRQPFSARAEVGLGGVALSGTF